MSEETEGNGLIIGGVVLVAVGFLCVGLVVLGYLFFGSSARPAYSLKKSVHSLTNPPAALNTAFDLTDSNQAKIEKAVRKKLKKPEGELTRVHLDKVTGLSLRNNQLTDVKGLEKLTQLKRLYLQYNQLTDVKGLENLTQLTYLSFRGNQLTDAKGLEKLTNLTWLSLFNNPDVTKAEIAELQKALPNCEIYSNPKK